MRPEEYIKKMQAKDYKETCDLLNSLPEVIEVKRNARIGIVTDRYYLLIDRFSGEWCIRYEEVKEDDFQTAPETIISVSDISILDALREVHKQIKEKI